MNCAASIPVTHHQPEIKVDPLEQGVHERYHLHDQLVLSQVVTALENHLFKYPQDNRVWCDIVQAHNLIQRKLTRGYKRLSSLLAIKKKIKALEP